MALVDVVQDNDGVTAELDDGRAVRAQWLVGCDGTGSTTPRWPASVSPACKLSERFLLADVHLDWDLDRSGTTGWVHPAGLVAAMPMPDPDGRNNLWRLFAYDPGHDEKPTEQEILERFRQVVPERTGRAVRFGDAEWLSLFTVHRRLADTYRQGRIFLAGDAAHAHAPFGGQGMLTGIGDAENLALKLALVVRGQASDPLIDTYEGERRPLATGVLRGTTTVTRINIAEHPIGRFVRDQMVVPLVGLAPIQRWATYTASQLWVSYRKGPLGGRGRKPRPGDRIADRTASERTAHRRAARRAGRAMGVARAEPRRVDGAAATRNGSTNISLCSDTTGRRRCWCVPTPTWPGAGNRRTRPASTVAGRCLRKGRGPDDPDAKPWATPRSGHG